MYSTYSISIHIFFSKINFQEPVFYFCKINSGVFLAKYARWLFIRLRVSYFFSGKLRVTLPEGKPADDGSAILKIKGFEPHHLLLDREQRVGFVQRTELV